LKLLNPTMDGPLSFRVFTEFSEARFGLQLPTDTADVLDYRFAGGQEFSIARRTKVFNSTTYFEDHPPVIWFADGSSLEGNQLVTLRSEMKGFDADRIEVWDWSGVDLKKEAQGVSQERDSIQFHVIGHLKALNRYDIVFDDDGARRGCRRRRRRQGGRCR